MVHTGMWIARSNCEATLKGKALLYLLETGALTCNGDGGKTQCSNEQIDKILRSENRRDDDDDDDGSGDDGDDGGIQVWWW